MIPKTQIVFLFLFLLRVVAHAVSAFTTVLAAMLDSCIRLSFSAPAAPGG